MSDVHKTTNVASSATATTCIFFILGAGASKDSGLQTYRGKDGYYEGKDVNPEYILNTSNSLEKVWDFLKPLYEQISKNVPGETYQLIKKLGKMYPASFILTQNVDGYADSTELPLVEIHGTAKTMTCFGCRKTKSANATDYLCECGKRYRPDIVLFGENLHRDQVQKVHNLLKRKPQYVLVIGTSLQFPYLRTFITKAKQRGALVFHINPDDNYHYNVRKRETWYDLSAAEGLIKFMSD